MSASTLAFLVAIVAFGVIAAAVLLALLPIALHAVQATSALSR